MTKIAIDEVYRFNSSQYQDDNYVNIINDENIKTAMTLRSQIVNLRKIKKNERVGYDGRAIADKDMIIATIYLGYADGLPLAIKDGTEVIGNIVHCKNHKSRLTIVNRMVDVRLTYDKGLDKHYGLVDLALKHNIFKQVSTRIELPDGTKQYQKTINSDPEKYFTKEILEQLDKAAAKEFKYGIEAEEAEST